MKMFHTLKPIFCRSINWNSFILIAALAIQLLYWFFFSRHIKPDFSITPNPPSKTEMAILSFGDQQFLYRMLGQRLQNAGDTFGETIPLKDYDYNKLQQWFYALDAIDTVSDYVPSIAGMYYAQSQNPEHSRYVVEYLVHHADHNPDNKWRWYTESVYLAAHRLKDMKLAHSIGDKLAPLNPDIVPLWVRVIVPFILQRDGDICSAYDLISKISPEEFLQIASDEVFSSRSVENNFLTNIVMKRLREIKEHPDFIKKCIRKR